MDMKIIRNRAWVDYQADKNGLIVSTDIHRVNQLLSALESHTDGQCPCVPKYARTDDTICPCKAAREDGICHCGLFDGRK